MEDNSNVWMEDNLKNYSFFNFNLIKCMALSEAVDSCTDYYIMTEKSKIVDFCTNDCLLVKREEEEKILLK